MKKSLSKKQIKHLANLAKLDLSQKELGKYSKDLSSILDYVRQLEEIDTSRVKPMAQALGIKNIMREDKIKKLDFQNANSGKYFKTKAIFN